MSTYQDPPQWLVNWAALNGRSVKRSYHSGGAGKPVAYWRLCRITRADAFFTLDVSVTCEEFMRKIAHRFSNTAELDEIFRNAVHLLNADFEEEAVDILKEFSGP